MIWGGISLYYGKLPLYIKKSTDSITSELYVNQVLHPIVSNYKGCILIQDGATSHTAKKTKEWCENMQIKVMTQSPKSPDMNPIEKIWNLLKNSVQKRSPKNKEELIEAIQKSWSEITQQTAENIIYHVVHQVCPKVLDVEGDWIKKF